MGKALIIKGADFSSVAIGHVDIPQELSEKAKRWIEASGNTSMSETQKFAVNSFVEDCASILPKITKLYLPMLAGSINKAFVNYCREDLHDDYQSELGTYIGLRNKGIYSKGNSYPNHVKFDSDTPLSSDDMSVFAFNVESYPAAESGQTINEGTFGIGTSASSRGMMEITTTATAVRVTAYINSVTTQANEAITTTGSENKMRGCVFGTAGIRYIKQDGTIASVNYTSSVEHVSSDKLYVLTNRAINGFAEEGVAYGAVIIGKALTDDEVLTLNSSLKTMFDALK